MRTTDKDGNQLKLNVLFCALAAGVKADEMRKRYKLSRHSLSVVRGAFIAANPNHLSKFQSQKVKAKIGRRNPEHRPLRFLVDECVSPAVTYYVSRYLGWATHIDFADLNGTKDPEVYQYAIDQGFDAIITRDRAGKGPNIASHDLTDIALGYAFTARQAEKKGDGFLTDIRFRHPVIIHVNGNSNWNNIKQRLSRQKFDLIDAIEARTSPILIIGKHQFQIGPSYQDIFHEAMKPSDEALGLKRQRKVNTDLRKAFIEDRISAGEKRSGKTYGRTTRRFWEERLGKLWDENNQSVPCARADQSGPMRSAP